ncbi:unnamed protein product [Moneuplotes crassus]|uniref:tRNA-uridine aminocarboxypropyltransferase 1 n=2 Tax=Euplotes crassus TaxID=5936 RepID=A0AAD2D106_EUPCR|nr:unnamed protein product [Moneuplotes crassus]
MEKISEKEKKRDLKEEDKKEEVSKQEEVRTKRRRSKSKKRREKKHVRTEKCTIPPTLEEIDERIKGSYLETMNFASFKPLTEIEGRIQCPKCKSNRKFYCYACYVPLARDVPQLKLPVNFTVLKHPGEKMGKSSIIASKIIAPDNVTIHNSLEISEFDYDSTILLFPKEDSVPITSMPKETLESVKNVVLIDSTWLQVNKFLQNENVSKLKTVVINTEKTIFWRYQRGVTDKNLSTIEAMYFFMRDYDKVMSEKDYDGKYDNLLYFYAYTYALIQNEYKKGLKKDKEFKTIKGYVKEKSEEDNKEGSG